MLIDSHSHLHNSEYFPGEARDYLARAKEAGVERVVVIGTSVADSAAAKEFAAKHEGVYWSFGIHPEQAGEKVPAEIKGDKRLIAVGEVGLDYHYGESEKAAQWKLLEEVLNLGIEAGLPFAFHVREAFPDFFAILDNFSAGEVRGVIHSFSDNKKNLAKCLDRGFYIGVNGMATYSTLPEPPLERAMFETDAPFLAPVPHRGERNEPAYIADIAQWVVEKYDVALKDVVKITTKNFEDLFLGGVAAG